MQILIILGIECLQQKEPDFSQMFLLFVHYVFHYHSRHFSSSVICSMSGEVFRIP
jgi:hypothetical protein